MVSITLTRDRHLGGLFHRHIAGHGVAFFTSNFHLAVTADLNSVEDGQTVFARGLDARCIRDRQFAKYNWTIWIIQYNVHTRGINGQITHDTSIGLQGKGIGGRVVAQLTCILTAQDVVLVLFSDRRFIDFDGRKTVLLAEQTGAAVGADAQLHQRIRAFGQRRSRQGEHHAGRHSRRGSPPGKIFSFHVQIPPLGDFYGGGYASCLSIAHFSGFWKQNCVNRDLNA